MIVFDLICEESHSFEVWFRSSNDYEDQQAKDIVECPICGSGQVRKAIMAPNVSAKSNQRTEKIQAKETWQDVPEDSQISISKPLAQEPAVKEEAVPELDSQTAEILNEAMGEMRKHVEENFDNVGADFAEEARKIHYGEVAERPIYGDSTAEEVVELIDEGVDVLPLAGPKTLDS